MNAKDEKRGRSLWSRCRNWFADWKLRHTVTEVIMLGETADGTLTFQQVREYDPSYRYYGVFDVDETTGGKSLLLIRQSLGVISLIPPLSRDYVENKIAQAEAWRRKAAKTSCVSATGS